MADIVTYILSLFSSWLGLFAAPFAKGNPDILWIIVPIFPMVYGITELLDKLTPTPSEEVVQEAPAYIPIQTTQAVIREQPDRQLNTETGQKRPDYPD